MDCCEEHGILLWWFYFLMNTPCSYFLRINASLFQFSFLQIRDDPLGVATEVPEGGLSDGVTLELVVPSNDHIVFKVEQ